MSLFAADTAPATVSESERPALLSALLRRFNHDLRTPLNTLSGWSELLRQGATDASRARHAAQVMSRSVREQTLLLEDYVDDMRSVLGELRLQATSLAAVDVAEAAAARLASQTAVHGVELEAQAVPTAWRVRGEWRHMVRLLYRVQRIAVRRAPPGSVLRQQVKVEGDWLRFALIAPATAAGLNEGAALDAQLARLAAAVAEADLDLCDGAAVTEARLCLPRVADAAAQSSQPAG